MAYLEFVLFEFLNEFTSTFQSTFLLDYSNQVHFCFLLLHVLLVFLCFYYDSLLLVFLEILRKKTIIDCNISIILITGFHTCLHLFIVIFSDFSSELQKLRTIPQTHC